MSENIPSPTASTSLHHKKSKRKYEKIKLPTPPPDPIIEKTDDHDEFLAYLDSLQKSNCSRSPPSTSIFTPAIATEDAFDHLEKLYKLMEQMLELREQNVRLHRRIRDLEHVHNLEKMYKQLDINCVQGECPELDKDTAFAETILESILQETKSPSKKSRLRQSISRRQRNRSGSIENDFPQFQQYRRASTCVDNRQLSPITTTTTPTTIKPSKVSKWTKVKAAFKWEKASSSVSDAKSQDSGIGTSSVPVEVARYLRVPSMATSGDDGSGHSPADSGAGAEISSTPGTLSTASSNDDFNRNEPHSPCEDFKSSDDEHSHACNISHSKDGSQKSNKSHHKTPWAKMKDIIQTRNSFKKKHRLSAQSDDIQIDIELCSDNEDVFVDNNDANKQRTDTEEVPPDIVARYQQAVAEDANISEKKTSKWTRVKKAFLATNETTLSPPPSPQPKENQIRFENDDPHTVEAEIQKNYKQLQKKLSIEFQEKLTEWERMKQSSPNSTNLSSSSCIGDENRDTAFAKKMEEWHKLKSQPSIKGRSVPMTSEENLPPEFRKKLQEWERIRKNSQKETTVTATTTTTTTTTTPRKKLADAPKWKSLSTHRTDNSPTIEYPVITEEFRKKLEEWKQIKSGGSGGSNLDESDKKKDLKTSPDLSRKNSSSKIGKKHEKELQWFEKELNKIEKEKQRLERERQKFIEREERLAKLRNSVIGSYKKEILIHTPSGFHRFEGISRKFAQKLYEWEKAQGIGPESSTFALLQSSSLVQDTNINPRQCSTTASLIRSKSADSIAISALNLTCPLMSQPSSLSLNNVEDLEKECLANSKTSSEETLNEPEALIVEVEDIVEETAAPLRTFRDKTQQPVYQREELKAMCEGETCIAPKVRRSESAKAQNNYNLIEEIFTILTVLTENELEIQKTQDSLIEIVENRRNDPNFFKLQSLDETQKGLSGHLSEQIVKLQDANNNVLSNLRKENPPENFLDVFETIQDLSSETGQLTERLNNEIKNRNVFEIPNETGATSLTPVLESIKDLRSKMLEMRRRLSYICAASDLTAPGRKVSRKKSIKRIISNESQNSGNEKCRFYIKSDTSNIQSQGAIRKRIRYRQKSLQSRSAIDTDDEDENVETKRSIHKKLTRTRSISEGSADKIDETQNKPNSEITVDEALIQKIVVPTKTNYVTISETTNDLSVDSPVSIFVKTTRKIFTPIVESSVNKNQLLSEGSNEIENSEKTEDINDIIEERIEERYEDSSKIQTPQLPVSASLQRKTKDISPSIRLMLAKYNEKLEENSCKSGVRSGSMSPSWRSPKSERRVKAQTEKYQRDLSKLTPNFHVHREVQKSASVGFLQNPNMNNKIEIKQNKFNEQNIIKSQSTSFISVEKDNKIMKLGVNTIEMPRHSPEIRLKKLQKAKENFLNSTPQSAPPQICSNEPIEFPTHNRLSQISVDSESSHDSAFLSGALIKSASAGMINVDAATYRQIDPEIHGDGYVSLPRSTKKPQKNCLFSQITSKFRKVKMRKGKDKMNVVPILCRQSLVVDINQEQPPLEQQENIQNLGENTGKSNDNDGKSTNWLKRRTKLFKK